MKQAKLLFLLRNDLASTSQRIIIEISEEDHEYCIGHGDDDREYVLKQNERYRVLEDPRGIRVFGTEIPFSVRAAETSGRGKSIFAHDKNGKVAAAYRSLTKEVLELERKTERFRDDAAR